MYWILYSEEATQDQWFVSGIRNTLANSADIAANRLGETIGWTKDYVSSLIHGS